MSAENKKQDLNKEISTRLSSNQWSQNMAQNVCTKCQPTNAFKLALKIMPISLAAISLLAINIALHHNHKPAIESPQRQAATSKMKKKFADNLKQVSFRKK